MVAALLLQGVQVDISDVTVITPGSKFRQTLTFTYPSADFNGPLQDVSFFLDFATCGDDTNFVAPGPGFFCVFDVCPQFKFTTPDTDNFQFTGPLSLTTKPGVNVALDSLVLTLDIEVIAPAQLCQTFGSFQFCFPANFRGVAGRLNSVIIQQVNLIAFGEVLVQNWPIQPDPARDLVILVPASVSRGGGLMGLLLVRD